MTYLHKFNLFFLFSLLAFSTVLHAGSSASKPIEPEMDRLDQAHMDHAKAYSLHFQSWFNSIFSQPQDKQCRALGMEVLRPEIARKLEPEEIIHELHYVIDVKKALLIAAKAPFLFQDREVSGKIIVALRFAARKQGDFEGFLDTLIAVQDKVLPVHLPAGYCETVIHMMAASKRSLSEMRRLADLIETHKEALFTNEMDLGEASFLVRDLFRDSKSVDVIERALLALPQVKEKLIKTIDGGMKGLDQVGVISRFVLCKKSPSDAVKMVNALDEYNDKIFTDEVLAGVNVHRTIFGAFLDSTREPDEIADFVAAITSHIARLYEFFSPVDVVRSFIECGQSPDEIRKMVELLLTYKDLGLYPPHFIDAAQNAEKMEAFAKALIAKRDVFDQLGDDLGCVFKALLEHIDDLSKIDYYIAAISPHLRDLVLSGEKGLSLGCISAFISNKKTREEIDAIMGIFKKVREEFYGRLESSHIGFGERMFLNRLIISKRDYSKPVEIEHAFLVELPKLFKDRLSNIGKEYLYFEIARTACDGAEIKGFVEAVLAHKDKLHLGDLTGKKHGGEPLYCDFLIKLANIPGGFKNIPAFAKAYDAQYALLYAKRERQKNFIYPKFIDEFSSV